MLRRRLLIVVLVGLLVVLTGCRREDNSVPEAEQQDRIIAAVSRTSEPSKLRVTWFPAPCESFDEVQVELDDEYANLRVRVTVDTANCPDPGPSETIVDLGAPLGDRQIWDRAFGNTVAIDG
jgi:hypothetical protein